MIRRIIVKNYKCLREFDLELNNDLNIIVGDNETGKSTLLEAINVALTGQLNGRGVSYEISPFLFNKSVAAQYIDDLRKQINVEPPKILIELYLEDSPELARLKGRNNSLREDATGLSIVIQFNDEYADEYKSYIAKPDEMRTIPTEYYEAKWYSFDYNPVRQVSLPIKTTLVDTTSVRLQSGTDYYIQKTIEDILEKKERAGLSLTYRKLRESFAQEDSIKNINERLKQDRSIISEKNLAVSIDISQKTSWEANLTSYLDDIPYQYIGKGDQNILKMIFALERKKAKESHVILIEEPENHLSFSTMSKLISMISEKCEGKQLIITTHSAFVLNKLGIEKLILLSDKLSSTTLKDLSNDTQRYFKKLPGYDTLRLVLAKKSILVEGPSDELFVQKAYSQKYNKLPIDDGIDVISAKGVSFKRFLEIAKKLKKAVTVITDNDGNCSKLKKKYEEYLDDPDVKICYDEDENCNTLEPQIVKYNDLSLLRKIFGSNFKSKEDIIEYMLDNKTECALKLFETSQRITIPPYVENAIQ